jgi:pimeloyl-ACP methyl ester carboxylesterase
VKTTLVSIPTDTIPLDGAWYEPENVPVRNAVLLFHGNTMNFYTGAPRFLPPALTQLGYACLAFNRRGHDILAIRDSRLAEGGAFQNYSQSIQDNRIAAEWVKAKGFADPIVIGHSNGGMLAVRHVADHPKTSKLVLLSAHCGGKDMLPLACKNGLLAQNRLSETMSEAKRRVEEGKGKTLLLLPGWWYAITAESFVDLAICPDILELAPQIGCPVLYVRGSQEPRDLYPAEEFAKRAGGPCRVEIVRDSGHFYVGHEETVAGLVSSWLKENKA